MRQRLAQRIEQQRTGLRHPAADDHEVQVAHRGHRRDRRGHRRRAAPERSQRNGVACVGGVGEFLGVGLRGVPAVLARPLRQVRARRDGLDAAVAAARAQRAVGFDDDVADVAGVTGAPVVGGAVEHQPAADPGRHHHAEQELRAPARPAPPLAQRHAQPVTAEPHRQPGQRPRPSRRSETVATQ